MDTLRPFDPNDIDESLTRVVAHAGHTYLMFPYINAIEPTPKFDSISHAIAGPAATVEDFAALSQSVRQAAGNAAWFISFSTPWLVRPSDATERRRTAYARAARR